MDTLEPEAQDPPVNDMSRRSRIRTLLTGAVIAAAALSTTAMGVASAGTAQAATASAANPCWRGAACLWSHVNQNQEGTRQGTHRTFWSPGTVDLFDVRFADVASSACNNTDGPVILTDTKSGWFDHSYRLESRQCINLTKVGLNDKVDRIKIMGN